MNGLSRDKPKQHEIVLSGDDDDTALQNPSCKMCKFCYSFETQGEWLHPCKCSGTMKWVHGGCFAHWLQKAPTQQQVQCLTCKYEYRKFYALKPFNDWCRPPLALSLWEVLEIVLDFYSTFKFLRGMLWTIEGKRSVLLQLAHTLFWRTFIATDRRLMYYSNLARVIASSVFEISVKNFTSEEESGEASSSEEES